MKLKKDFSEVFETNSVLFKICKTTLTVLEDLRKFVARLTWIFLEKEKASIQNCQGKHILCRMHFPEKMCHLRENYKKYAAAREIYVQA